MYSLNNPIASWTPPTPSRPRWHLSRTSTRPFKAMTLLAIWNWDGRPLAPCTSTTIRPLAWRWVAFWNNLTFDRTGLTCLSWLVDCMSWLGQRLGLKRQVSYIDPFAQDWYFAHFPCIITIILHTNMLSLRCLRRGSPTISINQAEISSSGLS